MKVRDIIIEVPTESSSNSLHEVVNIPTNQPGVLEAEQGTAYAQDISREFRKLGYSKIGSGADSTIWAKDASYAIKILMPEDEGSQAVEVFKKFYEFCQKRPDIPCLPVFNEYNTIDVLDKEFIQIDMERLYPIKKNTLDEGVVWFFSDFVLRQTPWNKVNHALGLDTTWKHYKEGAAGKLANAWQNLLLAGNEQKYTSYKILYNVMNVLFNTGRINKFGWDLHTENVMRRTNNQLVIIDPWFADAPLLTEVQRDESENTE